MTESISYTSKKAGLPPGSLIHLGKRMAEQVKVSVIDYSISNFLETHCESPSDCFDFKNKDSISWINVIGLHDTKAIAAIGKHFDLHPLLLEDVLNTGHRPKVEEFEHHTFLTLKMLSINESDNSLVSEQISFVLGNGWILSFQEQEDDVFDALRQTLKESKGSIRQKGTDYLLYRLIDTIVDHYFFVTEHISDVLEKLEESVLEAPETESLKEIQRLKRQLVNLRKATSPLREVLSTLYRDANSLIHEDTTRYLRDVYEHIIQVHDTIENQRDMIASIMDLYLSGVSNKMNQVMKLLTIISTIFIPLTFIAGIYGMNFENMPELRWQYGYYTIWGIMVIVTFAMIVYFRRKRWL